MKRLAVFAALVLAELLLASLWLDGAALQGQSGLPGQIGIWGAWVLRFGVGFAFAFIAFAGMQGELALDPLLAAAESRPVSSRIFYLHTIAALGFGVLSAALYGFLPSIGPSNGLAAAWIVAAAGTMWTITWAFVPWTFWRLLRDSTGPLWFYAALVAMLGVTMVRLSQSLWMGTAQVTFQLVQLILKPVLPGLIVQEERLRLVAPNFSVIIDQACSGLEGAGLMLIFTTVWLMLFRKDFRFPRSLLLIPLGVGALYVLNAFRIAVLLLIGNAGARQVAVGGFHSQAGWIAFNGVALAMTLVVPRLAWFRTRPAPMRESITEHNPAAAYLLPFLAILLAGMFARAASADFEWLYGLRLLASGVLLWRFRAAYRSIDFRASWISAGLGLALFIGWVGLDVWQGVAIAGMPEALAAAPAPLRVLWLVVRVVAHVGTVPLAEELAFRGFLMRRWDAADFEAVSLRQVSWTGVAISSLAFGLLHGDRWIAGTLAGLVLALATRRNGRLGDAILCHVVTNGLLAFWVIGRGQWQFW